MMPKAGGPSLSKVQAGETGVFVHESWYLRDQILILVIFAVFVDL